MATDTFINPKPGVTGVEMILTLTAEDGGDDLLTAGNGGSNDPMVVPAILDLSVGMANDLHIWTTLDNASKRQIATTATNNLAGNLVLEKDTFWGLSSADGVEFIGIFGLSTTKRVVALTLFMGDNSDSSTGITLSAIGSFTNLTLAMAADTTVWVTPFTIAVDGDWTKV